MFAVFFGVMWWRMLRMEIAKLADGSRRSRAGRSGHRRRAVGRLGPVAVRLPRPAVSGAIDEAENPALAEYNRMLAALAAHDREPSERREQEQEGR